MATIAKATPVYMLKQTVLASGRVYERGMAGSIEEFGDVFHPLRTAGYLTEIDRQTMASVANVKPIPSRSVQR